MKPTTSSWLTAILATALFATAVGAASARNLSISNQNIRAVFRPLIFSDGGASNRLSCTVTIEGTFHYRTILKSVGALLGYITRAQVEEGTCAGAGLLAGARARVLTETLPWHITYRGFRGTLPNIERIILQINRPRLTFFNIPIIAECKYEGALQGFFLPATNELQADETFGIPRTAESNGACPTPGFFRGVTRVTLLGTTTPVTVTLI